MNSETRQPPAPFDATFRRVRYRPDSRQARHHHDRTSLTLVYQGSLDEVVGSTREEAGPLSLVLKPAGTEHANRVGPEGAATVQIEFGPGFAWDDRSQNPLTWVWTHGGPSARRFLDLFATWGRGDEAPSELEDRVFDLLAGLEPPGEPPRGGQPAWLANVVDELEDTFRRPRSVRALARDAAVHPVTLARAHRRHFGCSITDRRRFLRVREAASMLVSETTSLSSVAFATGFADQPHLTRIFKGQTGLTPGVYRELLQS